MIPTIIFIRGQVESENADSVYELVEVHRVSFIVIADPKSFKQLEKCLDVAVVCKICSQQFRGICLSTCNHADLIDTIIFEIKGGFHIGPMISVGIHTSNNQSPWNLTIENHSIRCCSGPLINLNSA